MIPKHVIVRTAQAARLLSVSERRVQQLADDNELPSERDDRGHRVFTRDAIECLLASRDAREKTK